MLIFQAEGYGAADRAPRRSLTTGTPAGTAPAVPSRSTSTARIPIASAPATSCSIESPTWTASARPGAGELQRGAEHRAARLRLADLGGGQHAVDELAQPGALHDLVQRDVPVAHDDENGARGAKVAQDARRPPGTGGSAARPAARRAARRARARTPAPGARRAGPRCSPRAAARGRRGRTRCRGARGSGPSPRAAPRARPRPRPARRAPRARPRAAGTGPRARRACRARRGSTGTCEAAASREAGTSCDPVPGGEDRRVHREPDRAAASGAPARATAAPTPRLRRRWRAGTARAGSVAAT